MNGTNHPLLRFASGPAFDERAAFFAQPVTPLRDCTIVAVNPRLRTAPKRGSLPAPETFLNEASRRAKALSEKNRAALLESFAFRPLVTERHALEAVRLISRSFDFPNRGPYWAGRSYELEPGQRTLHGPKSKVVFTDADVKGAGPTLPAHRREHAMLDGLLTLSEAYAEFFFGELLLCGGARSSVGAYIFTTTELPPKSTLEGDVPSAVLVRWMREERRVGNLNCYPEKTRAAVVRYCIEKLVAQGELHANGTLAAYLEWFCDRMAENAARFARLGVVHFALHPQNVTLAAEVVDHGMSGYLSDEELTDRNVLWKFRTAANPDETFKNQPGRMLVLVRALRDVLASLQPEVRAVELTGRFERRFKAAWNARLPKRLVKASANDFDLLKKASWAFAPPAIG